jgi:hypothetical protein
MSETTKIVTFQTLQKVKKERDVLCRWKDYYTAQPHEELLDALVYEHENDFPLRRSPEPMDQLRHKALVEVLQVRARTEFLKSFLSEINRDGDMRMEQQ